MKRIKNLFTIFLFCGVCLVGYGNCSKLPLEPIVEQKIELASTKPEIVSAQLCAELRPIVTPGSKFIFIIDMSASNFGSWNPKQIPNGNGTPVTFNYWDPTKATDNNSDRIKAIEFFIDSCINQAGNRYSVIGFSKTAGIVSTSGASGTPTLSCLNPRFTSSNAVKLELQKLKEVQNKDRLWYEKWVDKYLTEPTPESLIMASTSYPQALTCATDLLTYDLLYDPASVSDFYHVFFISDGKPMDRNDVDCKDNVKFPTDADKQKCFYDKSVNSIQLLRTASLSQARDLRLYSVFYGASEEVPEVMNAMAASGGSETALQLNSFASDPKALCNIIVAKSYNQFTPDQIHAIPLTLRPWQGELLADSDMDGVPDKIEKQLGWDPQNARSLSITGVLDGICYSIGGETECAKRRRSISVCDPLKFKGFNLTDCDLQILNISGGNHTGVDSDFDGITDYIEIIKGTNPTAKDANQDTDRDGKTNKEELMLGSDPNFYDPDFTSEKFNQIKLVFEPDLNSKDPLCHQSSANIDIISIIGLPTLGVYTNLDNASVLNHEPFSHKVMLFYQLNQESGAAPEKEQYYRIIDYNYATVSGTTLMMPTEVSITQKSFRYLGKVSQ